MARDAKSFTRGAADDNVNVLGIQGVLIEKLARPNLGEIGLDRQGVRVISFICCEEIFVRVNTCDNIITSLKKTLGEPSTTTEEVKNFT